MKIDKFKKMMETLTDDQQKELEELLSDTVQEAKKVRKDYDDNPSELSGSTIQVHQDSPFVDERVPDDSNWRHVITAPADEVLKNVTEHNKKIKQKNNKKA